MNRIDRRTGAILLVGVLALATFALPQSATPRAEAATPRIMVVGDSISQGHEGDFTWRYRLKQHLTSKGAASDFVGPWTGTSKHPADPQAPQAPIHNAAYRPGISFADNQNYAQWGWQMAQAKSSIGSQVSAQQPDYLLVALGFNDLGWGVSDAAGLRENLRQLIANARAAKPNVKILVGNVVQRTPLAVNPTLQVMTREYNQALPGFLAGLSTATSPVAPVDLDAPYNEYTHTYDGLHPNVRGEYVIAKQFADVLAARFGLGAGFGAVPATVPAELTPAAPASITATRQSNGDVLIKWPHSFGASGYQLFWRDKTAGSAWQPYAYDTAGDRWLESFHPWGREMQYYVKVRHGNLTGGSSPIATAVPIGQVQNLRGVSPQAYTVKLTWNAVAGADDYHVYSKPGCTLSTPGASGWEIVQWGLGQTTTWTQTGVLATCRQYFVKASHLNVQGKPSSVVLVRPQP